MKKIKNNRLKLSIGLALAMSMPVLSNNAVAANYCLPYQIITSENTNNNFGFIPLVTKDAVGGCTGIKGVDEFSGSAASLIQKFKDDIVKAAKVVTDQLKENSAAEISTISESTDTILKTMAAINDSQTRDFINLSRFFLDMEMNYMSELKEREVRSMSAPVALNDTQEVYQYILHSIDEEIKTGTKHSQPLIAQMTKTDKTAGGTIIPVQIKAGENPYSSTGKNCKSYDPAVDKTPSECFYGVKDFPSDKLSKLFNECSREKRRIVSSLKKSSTADTISRQVNKSQDDFMEITGNLRGSSINNRLRLQDDISCNISDMENKICHPELTKRAYVEKVINLEIVPNGDTSSSNFLSPTPIGSVDGKFDLEVDPKDLKAVGLASLDRNSKNSAGKNNAVSSNTVPIVNTYRTSSQYLSAIAFINNILAKELVPNQDPASRTASSNALYQTRFLSRSAAMSLAESSMSKSIEMRLGKKMKEAIESSANLNPELEINGKAGKVVVEDINGAGYLDELADSIHKDYQKIVVSNENGNSGIEEISVMTPDAIKEWQLTTVIRQNELAIIQFEQQERMELLLAAILSQLTNSASEVNYLEEIRRK